MMHPTPTAPDAHKFVCSECGKLESVKKGKTILGKNIVCDACFRNISPERIDYLLENKVIPGKATQADIEAPGAIPEPKVDKAAEWKKVAAERMKVRNQKVKQAQQLILKLSDAQLDKFIGVVGK